MPIVEIFYVIYNFLLIFLYEFDFVWFAGMRCVSHRFAL